MASTYTPNVGIEKVAVGEQDGSWGNTLRDNWDIMDQAIGGQVTVTVATAGTSGSPNTLPITDGTLSNGRAPFLIFNDGADLGATVYVQLTPNSAKKIVHVRNSLSGSRDLVLFQGTYNASNDYTLPAGKDAVLRFDGGGSGAVVADAFVDWKLTKIDTATLAIGGTSVTATAADLNLLDGVTATTAELNKVDGFTGTFTDLNYAAALNATTVTATEFGYLNGVIDNIQTQLNTKISGNQTITLSGDATGSGTTSIAVAVVNDSHSHGNTTITSVDASKVSTGTLADARIPSLATSKITSGTFADARISQSSVTQHQAAINAGQVDGKSISVVASLPASPDANTIYFVTS